MNRPESSSRVALSPRKTISVVPSNNINETLTNNSGLKVSSIEITKSTSHASLKKAFLDHHTSLYAHLHEDYLPPESLDKEAELLEAERIRGKEMRENWAKQIGGNQIGKMDKGQKGEYSSAWRPLSLVNKRQDGGIKKGHTRFISQQNPVLSETMMEPAWGNGSVSRRRRTSEGSLSTVSRASLEIDVEDESEIDQGPDQEVLDDEETTGSRREEKSTYSWATSFTGESQDLRAAAAYIRDSFEDQSRISANVDSRSMVDVTPDKVKRRRKRIVALAHTARQLEGVGSREPEDPAFWGKLVRAWNDRPGVQAPLPILQHNPDISYFEDPTATTTLNSFSPPLSPAFGTHFGTPADDLIDTPEMPNIDPHHHNAAQRGYGNHLTYDGEGREDGNDSETGSGSLVRGSRSFRMSYASSLHDLAFEEPNRSANAKPWMSSAAKGRWSGAWDGWGIRPPSGVIIDERNGLNRESSGERMFNSMRQPNLSAARERSFQGEPSYLGESHRQPYEPKAGGEVGIGLMSSWWQERDATKRAEHLGLEEEAQGENRGSNFHQGEEGIQWSFMDSMKKSLKDTTPIKNVSNNIITRNAVITPTRSEEGNTNCNSNSNNNSGISTPSFGTKRNQSAEKQWVMESMEKVSKTQIKLHHPISITIKDHQDANRVEMIPDIPGDIEMMKEECIVDRPMKRIPSSPSTPIRQIHHHHNHAITETKGNMRGLHLDYIKSINTANNSISVSKEMRTTTTIMSQETEEGREFPFSSLCRSPSCSTRSLTSSPPQQAHLQQAIVMQVRRNSTSFPRMIQQGQGSEKRKIENQENIGQDGWDGLGSGSRLFNILQDRPSLRKTTSEPAIKTALLAELEMPVQIPPILLQSADGANLLSEQSPATIVNLTQSPLHLLPPGGSRITNGPLPSDSSFPTNLSSTLEDSNSRQHSTPKFANLKGSNLSSPFSYPKESKGTNGDIQHPPIGQWSRSHPPDRPSPPTVLLGDQNQLCQGMNHDIHSAPPDVPFKDEAQDITRRKDRGHLLPLMFFLGFLMPWCWILGGWPPRSLYVEREDTREEKEPHWLLHRNIWIRRSRIAALIVLPTVAVLAVVAVIVLAVMRR